VGNGWQNQSASGACLNDGSFGHASQTMTGGCKTNRPDRHVLQIRRSHDRKGPSFCFLAPASDGVRWTSHADQVSALQFLVVTRPHVNAGALASRPRRSESYT
jgi:hypothetical protein